MPIVANQRLPLLARTLQGHLGGSFGIQIEAMGEDGIWRPATLESYTHAHSEREKQEASYPHAFVWQPSPRAGGEIELIELPRGSYRHMKYPMAELSNGHSSMLDLRKMNELEADEKSFGELGLDSPIVQDRWNQVKNKCQRSIENWRKATWGKDLPISTKVGFSVSEIDLAPEPIAAVIAKKATVEEAIRQF